MPPVCRFCRKSESAVGNEIVVPCRCPTHSNSYHIQCFGLRHRVQGQPKQCGTCKCMYHFRTDLTPLEEAQIHAYANKTICLHAIVWPLVAFCVVWGLYLFLVRSRWCPSHVDVWYRAREAELFLSIENDVRYVMQYFFTGRRHEVTRNDTLELLTRESQTMPYDLWLPVRVLIQKPDTFGIYLLFLAWIVGFLITTGVVSVFLSSVGVWAMFFFLYYLGDVAKLSTEWQIRCSITIHLTFMLMGLGVLVWHLPDLLGFVLDWRQNTIQQKREQLERTPRVLDAMVEIRDAVERVIPVDGLIDLVLEYHE